jgi:hypothetical protein
MQRLRTTAFRRPKFQHKGQRSRACLTPKAHSCPPPQTVRMASPDKRSVGGSTELFFYADRPLRFICSSQYPHSKPPVSTCFKTPNNKRKRHFSKCILRASRLILSASLMDTTRLDEFDGHLILLSLHNTTRNRYRAGLRCKRDKRSY